MVAECELPLRLEEGKGSMRRVVLNFCQIRASKLALSPHIAWRMKRTSAGLRLGLLLRKQWRFPARYSSPRKSVFENLAESRRTSKQKNHFVTKSENILCMNELDRRTNVT